jgi:hypothetical protein
MKNKIKVLVLSLTLGASGVVADESLVGIEGTFGAFNVDHENIITGEAVNKNVNLAGGGLKIGAQSEHYRLFLSANYYAASDDDYNYVATYGLELDYLIKPSKNFDIFLGLNGGMANIEQIDYMQLKRTSSDPYIGGSAGVNIHMSKTIDIELGGRMLFMDISNTRSDVKYTYNTLASGYASVIFKFTMD